MTASDRRRQSGWLRAVTTAASERPLAVLVIAAFVVFNAVEIARIEYAASDENVYFYMGYLVADGELPYRDFHFAHPPLRLLPPAIVFAFAGFSFVALKLIPIAFANATGVLIWRITRAVSPRAGMLACLLYLTSYTAFFCSSFYMGTEATICVRVQGVATAA